MIPINEIQVGNWVEHKNRYCQISMILFDSKSVILCNNYNYSVSCYDINPIEIDEPKEYIIEKLMELPNKDAIINYMYDNKICQLHKLQNKCKEAKNVML